MDTYNEMKKEWIFSKYFLIILICLIIVIADFLLIQTDIGQAWWATSLLATTWQKIIYNWILPLSFSFWIIFVETLNYKIINSKAINRFILNMSSLISPSYDVAKWYAYRSMRSNQNFIQIFNIFLVNSCSSCPN
jgi:cell division protein FtsW (lipid II flippase)